MDERMVSYIILGLIVMIAAVTIFVDIFTNKMEKARMMLYDRELILKHQRARTTSAEYTNIPQRISQKSSIGILETPEKIISLEEYKRLHR